MRKKMKIPQGCTSVTQRSPVPFVVAASALAVYALFFPLYRPPFLILGICGAAFVYLIFSAFLPKRVIYKAESEKKAEKSEEQELLERIKTANNLIFDGQINRKICRIEDACRLILSETEKCPKKREKLRRFMRYYLPAAVKLTESYASLGTRAERGENLREAKEKISLMLDRMGESFEKQYDGLFEEKRADISADISVIKASLRENGL